ncbi:MAG: hypothetical protein M1595_00095 [Candidatus Thermoplasmatota archaeon]|jgi:hypothetical protein|nr:hypothetical protein [Candidatus Thermoplasmatota archaeon]
MDRKTVKDLRNLVKSVRNKSFPYTRRKEKKRNLHDYDRAYVNETANVLGTIRDAVNIASFRILEEKIVAQCHPSPHLIL